MRSMTCILCLTLLQTFGCSVERGPAVPDYPADKVAGGVYVIHGPLTTPDPQNQGFMNNPGIVIGKTGVIIIDPGASVQSGEMVLRAVGKLTDKPVLAVFNSHIHGDHWLGNQAIHTAYPDAPIYGHPNMIELIDKGEGTAWVKLMEQLTEGKTLGTKVVAPGFPAKHGDEIGIDGLTFRIYNYGKAHTSSDIMIEVVEAGVIFLGDNVTNGRIPRIDEGDVQGNIRSCEEIIKRGKKVYVPGHGRTGGEELVAAMHRYFSTVYSGVKRLYEDGLGDFEMKDEIRASLTDFADWISFDEQLGRHISLSYLQIEAADF